MAVTPVEDLTSYPSILGGRVKTLHPKVFGGILGRRDLDSDVAQLEEYDIPPIDLVIVDLYPFEATVAAGGTEADDDREDRHRGHQPDPRCGEEPRGRGDRALHGPLR
jgi:AICAR transformylase/IMP cyclohydrolase PurH